MGEDECSGKEIGNKESPLILENILATHDDVAQAFSHFSYTYSGKKMLICDLQGVYDERNKLLRFTDPVIHYHNLSKKKNRRRIYGRTDMGQKGISNFLSSHTCSQLCKHLLRGFMTPAKSARSSLTILSKHVEQT